MEHTNMDINKIVNPGRTTDGEVFLRIECCYGNLSINGVVGPKSNGCHNCGQILDTLDEITVYSEGWNPERVSTLKDL